MIPQSQGGRAADLVSALKTIGITDLVVSPGSRSTPLVLAAIATRIPCHSIIDERSAAFFALGYARGTGRAAPLITTSGTAGAHAFPAIIEAHATGYPMVVITADRPERLRDCGASQTIDQRHLFGRYCRYFADIDLQSIERNALLRIVAQAGLHLRSGPVHLNVRAEKPLEHRYTTPPPDSVQMPMAFEAQAAPGPGAIDAVAEFVAGARRPLVVCGPRPYRSQATSQRDQEALWTFLTRSGWTLYAEATSGFRFADGPACPLVENLGTLSEAPDAILQLGRAPISGAYPALDGIPKWVISDADWQDPSSQAHIIQAPVAETLEALTARLPGAGAPRAISGPLPIASPETRVALRVLETITDDALLMVGNSLAVRHLDAMATFSRRLRVLHQRGAAGIDGLINAAAGTSLGAQEPVTLLLGDVSFAHDLAGLINLRNIETPLTIVVLDNGGGRIFDRLPVAALELGVGQALFTTPPRIDIAGVCKALGIDATACKPDAELEPTLRAAQCRSGASVVVIEIEATP